jgi:hypothetical protein
VDGRVGDPWNARNDYELRWAHWVHNAEDLASIGSRRLIADPSTMAPGLREMLVDGWRGKTYRIDVTGDPSRNASFALAVTYRITCES